MFRSLPLAEYGVEWIEPPRLAAHPLDESRAAFLHRSVDDTARGLGADSIGGDDRAYRRLMAPLVEAWPLLEDAVLGPLAWPRHPFTLAGFGLKALRSAAGVARSSFATREAQALFAGIAGHGMLPLEQRPTAGVGLVLALMAHVAGWPLPKGGAQSISNALAAYFRSLGGKIVTSHAVASLDELPPARAILCDLSPRPFLRVAGARLPARYRRALERYRYGMGVFKVDWALDGPIPWRNPECALAGTVHLGGTLEEVAAAEEDVWAGRHPERPFVLLTQPTLFDSSRAPAGRHVAWTYCHVPRGSHVDMLPAIERQVERFAPGFRDRVLARAVMTPADVERHNPNYVGGDIGAGVTDLRQLFRRPTWSTYATPVRGLYLCSAATPPGVGVHGMCGYHAARRALREVLRD